MKTTRQRILDYLNIKQAATAGEMARALHLTAADVRHHLNVLAGEGAVGVIGERATQGRGRPSKLYGLAGLLSEHNLDRLASALLDEMNSAGGAPVLPGDDASSSRRQGVYAALARRMAPGSLPGRSPGKNLLQAVEHLNSQHYQARWEAHAQGPRVILGHCPYAALLAGHPDICQMDAGILERLLGQPVRQTARREPNPQGMPQCVFVLDKSLSVSSG